MVHIINLGVGLILALVLVVSFCQRHKWTNGHLLKGKICTLVGKAQSKRRGHKSEEITLEGVKEDTNAVKVEEGESNCVDFEDETKQAEDGSVTKQIRGENSCKGNEEEIVAHVELLEDGKSSNQVVAAIKQPADAREEDENMSSEEVSQSQ